MNDEIKQTIQQALVSMRERIEDAKQGWYTTGNDHWLPRIDAALAAMEQEPQPAVTMDSLRSPQVPAGVRDAIEDLRALATVYVASGEDNDDDKRICLEAAQVIRLWLDQEARHE